ncbi:MAG: BRCT domain-containing protein [Planctomycetota bacterium]|jgi:predicted nuclease with TOPRIM domain
MARGQGGIHFSYLIVVVVICIMTILFAFSQNSTIADLEASAVKLREERDAKENQVRDLSTRYDDLSEVVTGSAAESPDVDLLKGKLDQCGNDLKDVLGMSAVPTPLGMDDALGEMTKALTSLKSSLEQQTATAVSATDRSLQHQQEVQEVRNEFQARVDELRNENNDLQTQLERTRADSREEVSRLQNEIQELEEDSSSRLYAVNRDLQITQGLLDKAHQRIKQLEYELKQEQDWGMVDPDGEVLRVEEELGFAWINIGRQDRLRRGLVFQVFQTVGGGKRVTKGRVEVARVEEDFAEVRILETIDPYNPIAIGDQVTSPFYNKETTPIFVFAGDRPVNNRLSREEMVQKIEAFGGTVEDDVRLETAFVVALAGYAETDEYDEARSLGVTILREQELLEFIQP